MAAINIQSLFADIIDTPEQRQMKMLQEGMLRGDRLASGLTGLTRAAAPLAQVAGQLGVQRQENLRRAVQPMLGIDPRTTGEKLQDQLRNIDTSTPQGLMQAAQAVQQIDPVRAAALRQAATELTKQEEERTLRLQGERQRQRLAEAASQRAEDQLSLQTGQFLQGMQDSALRNQEVRLNIQRLEGAITDEETRRELEAAARNSKKDLEMTLAATYAQNPATKELSDYIKSGSMSLQGLESLIMPQQTEWTFDTQQFIGKDGNPVNMRVAIDKNNPENIVLMNPAKDQPEPVELPDVPKLSTQEIEDQYAPTIANNTTLTSLIEGRSRMFGADDPAAMTVQEVADLMHTMRYKYTLPLSAVNTALTELARNNPDALARGIIPQEYITLAQQSVGAGGNAPLDQGSPQGSVAQPSVLDDEALSKYPDFRVLQSGRQPIPPQPQAVPNPFNVGISTTPPASPDMRLGTPATGYDAAFEQQIKMEEERVRNGVVSPARLNVVRNNYVSALEKNKEKLQNEIRYLKGLSKRASPNNESRISAVQTQLDAVNEKIRRYKITN